MTQLVKKFRRSFFLKVFTLTAVVSMILISFIGSSLYNRLEDGIYREKTASAISEGRAALQFAEYRLTVATLSPTSDYKALVEEIVNSTNVSAEESGREVALFHSRGQKIKGIAPINTSNFLKPESIPTALRKQIKENSELSWQRGNLKYVNNREIPGIFIGKELDIPSLGKFEMYLAYDFVAQQRSIDLIGRSLWGTGILLLVLILLTASIVLRIAIKPIQIAAESAESITAGDLKRRMSVNGEDETARLGIAFNQMATTLAEQINRLENLSRIQQRFVSDVSHELRTPLTTIRMAADVIGEARQSFDPNVARSAELLQSQIEKFEQLLQDLLEVSRFDAEAATLNIAKVDIATVVKKCVDDLSIVANEKESEIRFIEPSERVMLDADSRRLERIIRNLLTNAIDHSEGRPVDVTIVESDDAVAVGVRDYGIGIEKQYWNRVFDRFWRADPSRSRIRGGTGLGLSIAREDAALHNGEIKVWGEIGKGANFVLTLPKSTGELIKQYPLTENPQQ
ncbi:MAG: MtrAB system histidine kinase MtrB [Actinomycetales bacterium]